jgi:hypothetical protein
MDSDRLKMIDVMFFKSPRPFFKNGHFKNVQF